MVSQMGSSSPSRPRTAVNHFSVFDDRKSNFLNSQEGQTCGLSCCDGGSSNGERHTR